MEGLAVAPVPDLGLCLLSMRAFPSGETIFTERTSLFWPQHPPPPATPAPPWLTATMATRLAVLHRAAASLGLPVHAMLPLLATPSKENDPALFVPARKGTDSTDRDGNNGDRHFGDAEAVEAAVLEADTEGLGFLGCMSLSRFLLICWANAHLASYGGVEFGALFSVASRMSHSCSPNAVFECSLSMAGQNDGDGDTGTAGLLAVVVVRAFMPLGVGDVVSVSYIPDASLCLPAPDRSRELLEGKFFACRCSRCMGPDGARTLPCPRCRSVAIRTARRAEIGEGPWVCKMCDSVMADAEMPLAAEAELGRELREELEGGGGPGFVERRIDPFRAKAVSALGLNHGYVARCDDLASTYYASVGDRRRAADSALAFLDWHETNVVDSCPASACSRLLWCAMDLWSLGRNKTLLSLLDNDDRLARLAAYFGPGDQDVRALALFVAQSKRCAHPSCPTPFVENTSRCSKCKTARYCGRECQARHWDEGHKQSCIKCTEE